MELVAIIATIILLATILTMVFSFAAYFVTRAKTIMKKREQPEQNHEEREDPSERIYFERYRPGSHGGATPSQTTAKSDDQWM